MNNFFWPMFIGNKETIATDDNIISYHLMADGIYCKRKVFKDKYIFYKDDNVPDLIKGFENLAPIKDIKIPSLLLYKTIDFFKYVSSHFKSNMEAYVLYALDPNNNYFMYIPEQEIGSASVHYDISKFHAMFPGCYIIADAHSHNTMGAFFSGTDDNDDHRGRYSVVVGKVNQIIPEIKCRFNYGSKHVLVTLEDMFEDNTNYVDMEYDLSQEVKKLTRATETIVSGVDFSGIYYPKGVASEYFGNEDYYSNYSRDVKSFKPNNASNVFGVGRCTKCGNFSRLDKLDRFDGELLCEKCAVKLGAFHACE